MWTHCKNFGKESTETVAVTQAGPGRPEYEARVTGEHQVSIMHCQPLTTSTSVPCTPTDLSYQQHVIPSSMLCRDYSIDLPPEYEKDCTKAPWRFAYRKLCVLVLALFSILLVAMFVQFWYFSRLNPVLDSGFLCVQCSKLRLSADPLDDYTVGLRVYKKQDTVFCCARNHTQQQQILDAVSLYTLSAMHAFPLLQLRIFLLQVYTGVSGVAIHRLGLFDP